MMERPGVTGGYTNVDRRCALYGCLPFRIDEFNCDGAVGVR
jgi:hypothetical protein